MASARFPNKQHKATQTTPEECGEISTLTISGINSGSKLVSFFFVSFFLFASAQSLK